MGGPLSPANVSRVGMVSAGAGGQFVSPRAEAWKRPEPSLRISLASVLLAVLSRLLVMHLGWLPCFRLSDRLVPVRYLSGYRRRQRCLDHGLIFCGFGPRRTGAPHYRSGRNRGWAG